MSADISVPSPLEDWSGWIPLDGASRNEQIPTTAGLYKIRQKGRTALEYVGQTGGSLRARLGMLRGIYRPLMPYRDPHTAAPALWALRHRDGCDFEVSVTIVPGEGPWRKALEATAITLYRLETGRSPSWNFGRMPAGYRISTGNNMQLVESGRRARGGLDEAAPLAAENVRPTAYPAGDPEAPDWMGWKWSPWVPLPEARRAAAGVGLYRIRTAQAARLAYIGQGIIPSRLSVHMAKGNKSDHRQASHFSEQAAASWVALPGAQRTHLLEHENDLIAAHVLITGRQPAAQFLG